MDCAICGRTIEAGELFVSTTGGEVVHVACADQQARTAYGRRTVAALASAGLFASIIWVADCVSLGKIGLALLIAVLIAGHIVINWRWWRLTIPVR